VCLLKKALHDFKKASRMWFGKLKQSLNNMDFKVCQSDDSLFVRIDEEIIYIPVYVDDMVVTGSSSVKVEECLNTLKSEIAVKSMWRIRIFLGN